MVSEVFDLFIDLDATQVRVNFPIIYMVARDGIAKRELADQAPDLRPLFDQILSAIPKPAAPIDWRAPVARRTLTITRRWTAHDGSISSGAIAIGDLISICKLDGRVEKTKVTKLYDVEGMKQVPIDHAKAGEMVALTE